MAITSLSAQYISASFQNLVQVSSSGQLFDGAGNQITNLTASFAVTASYALNAGTSIDTGSFATTGSNVFNGSQTVNGDLIVTGSITAYQYVVSSSVINETIVFSSGSTIFGNDIADTHTFTGSLYMSGSIYTPESIHFYTTASAVTQVGQLGWDDGHGTLDLMLKGGNVNVELGQENVVLVYNGNGTSFNKGEVVFVSGSQGNRPSVNRAIATSDGYSATTLGFAAETIAPGEEGFVTTFGFINNINTSGSIGGAPVWLSPTVSGSWTTTKPVAPDHTVLLGYIVRVSPTVGSIFVHISNGWEIGELHDVRDTTTTSSFGDLIVKSGSIWVTNKQLTGSYSVKGTWNVTGSLTVTGSSTFKVIGPSEFTGSVAINGSLSAPASSITAQSVTASLFGTASYAVNSLTASYALSGGSGGTSATVATAQTGSVSSTTSETLIQTLTIPANTLTTNDFARFSTKIFATNSNNYTVALYINSSNTLNGSEKNITTLPVNSSIKFVIPTRTIAVNNVTTDTNWISDNSQVQDPIQGTSALAHASSSIDWTTTQYALVSVTPQNAGDSFICRGTYFEKI
jgi:hypothetical protein